MLIRFFKSTQPIALFVLPLITTLFVVFAFLLRKNNPEVELTHGLLFSFFKASSLKLSPFFSGLLAISLITFQAIYFNKIVSMFDVLYKPSNLPALIYVVFGCLVPAFTGLHAFLIINTMLLWVIHKIFALYKNDATLGRCFDIGFLISIVSMFYFPCIILFLFYIISLSIFQPFAWRDYVLSFMGLLAPWFLVWIVLFLNDNSHLMAALFSAKNFKPVFLLQTITNKNIITIGSLSLLLIVSLYKLRSNYYKNVIKTRNCQLSFLLLLVTTGFITLIPVEHSVAKFSLLIIPVSVFVSYFFLVLKKVWLAEMVFMCLLALLIYNYF